MAICGQRYPLPCLDERTKVPLVSTGLRPFPKRDEKVKRKLGQKIFTLRTDIPTDIPTDILTDKPSCRDTWAHLEIFIRAHAILLSPLLWSVHPDFKLGSSKRHRCPCPMNKMASASLPLPTRSRSQALTMFSSILGYSGGRRDGRGQDDVNQRLS